MCKLLFARWYLQAQTMPAVCARIRAVSHDDLDLYCVYVEWLTDSDTAYEVKQPQGIIELKEQWT